MHRGKEHTAEGKKHEKLCGSERLHGVWGERLVEENSRNQAEKEPCCAP